MTDSVLWLLYIIGAVVALALVLRRRWRIVPSTFVGMIPTLLGWLAIYLTMAQEDRPKWWRVDLSLNLSFALIFAACGAAFGMFTLSRQRED